MSTLTVHNIDDLIKSQLEINAIKHNCSIDEEVCHILKQALFPTERQTKLGSYLHQQIIELTGGVELELPERSLPRPSPDFSEHAE
ncbi:MAG: hypothetical protein PHU14_07545 [Methylovulum sp.]|nr:hypothetical protein [Methylovulum sp.]